MVKSTNDAQSDPLEGFWSKGSPANHSVQIYTSDDAFMNTLEQFVASGLEADECVIVIASLAHRSALEKRLIMRGVDMAGYGAHDHYIALDARMSVSLFMVEDWLNEELLGRFLGQLFMRAQNTGRKVRIFGEMVAVLWSRGQQEAALRLEQFGNKLCAENDIKIFCAYPQSSFTRNSGASPQEIYALHTHVVAG